MNLADKVIIITGSSQGLGKGLAQSFKKEGAKVIISSHDTKSLEDTSKEIDCDFVAADVTKSEEVQKLMDMVLQKYGHVDIWINNAGIQIAPSLMEEVDIEKLKRLYDVNFFGYFYGCQVALRTFKKQSFGTIININSTAGLDGKPNLSAYTSSKFAIKGLTESIRKELVGSNIDILGVFPGGIQTDIYKEKYPEDLHEYMIVESVVVKVVNNLKSETPEIDLIIKRPVK